jgi:hypothetical protein
LPKRSTERQVDRWEFPQSSTFWKSGGVGHFGVQFLEFSFFYGLISIQLTVASPLTPDEFRHMKPVPHLAKL